MKHIIIGDLHGKDCWEEIDIYKFDKVVFLGDYVDSDDVGNKAIYDNLCRIIYSKQKHPDKVELLLGNHELQYMYFPFYINNSFNAGLQRQLTELLNSNKNLFSVAYQRGNFICTHAGITNSWYKEFLRLPILTRIGDPADTLADLLNKVDQTGQRYLLHAVGHKRGGQGNGGITWADKQETSDDMLAGFNQVVGHTATAYPETITDAGSSVTYINVLDRMPYFYEVES